MKNLFNDLHNSEKNRILEMHKGATKRNYVSEQEENLDEFFFEKDSEEKAEEKVDDFIKEIKEMLMRGKFSGEWKFFSETEPKLDLNALISKIREICDKYEE
jgi:hypothetical protein